MPVRPEPAKLETGHSDECQRIAVFVAANKASGIIILGDWLPGLLLVLPSIKDPRSKRTRQGQPVREHDDGGQQRPSLLLVEAHPHETSRVGN